MSSSGVPRVRVYFFPPTPFKEKVPEGVNKKKGISFGHVALEILTSVGNDAAREQKGADVRDRKDNEASREDDSPKSNYIGFWPYLSFWPKNNCDSDVCRTQEDHFHNEPADRRLSKRGLGDIRKIELCNVDVEKIERAWREMGPLSWATSGSSPFRLSDEYNCAGLTLFLLSKGGVPNPYKKRVNTIFRNALWWGGASIVFGTKSYLFYKSLSVTDALTTARQNFERATQTSTRCSKTAREALLLNKPHNEAQVAAIDLADMLMQEAVLTVSDRVNEVYNTVKVGRSYLQSASIVAIISGGIMIGGGYFCARILGGTITPSNVETVVQRAKEKEQEKPALEHRSSNHVGWLAALGGASIFCLIFKRR